MKRIALTLFALLALAALAACGSDVIVIKNPTGEIAETAAIVQPTTSPEGAAGGFVFETDGTRVAIDALFAPVREALGEPKQYAEEPSCAFEGKDKRYVYEHFEIDTYPADAERVMAVYLLDDLNSTAEGLRIGDSRARMESLYGKPASTVGSEEIYEKGGMKLKIILENDAVTYITYASRVLGQVAGGN